MDGISLGVMCTSRLPSMMSLKSILSRNTAVQGRVKALTVLGPAGDGTGVGPAGDGGEYSPSEEVEARSHRILATLLGVRRAKPKS